MEYMYTMFEGFHFYQIFVIDLLQMYLMHKTQLIMPFVKFYWNQSLHYIVYNVAVSLVHLYIIFMLYILYFSTCK